MSNFVKNSNFRNLTALGILVVLVVATFSGVLLHPFSRIAVNRTSEFYSVTAPLRIYGFGQIARGEIPLWNPYVYSGVPFLASGESALFYPVNWLHMVLPFSVAVNFSIVLNILIGMLLMYIWAASRGIRHYVRIVPPVMFMFGAPLFLYVHTASLSNLSTVIWAIPVFMAVDMAFDRSSRLACIAMGGTAVCMQVFAGHGQYLFYTAIAAVIYFVVRCVTQRKGLRSFLSAIGSFSAMYLIGIWMSAVQFLPQMEVIRVSSRGQKLSLDFVSLFSFPPENCILSVAPGFFGDFITTPYWGRWYLWEVSVFVGVSGLALIFAGLILSRDKIRIPCGVTTTVLTILAMGSYTPCMNVLYSYLPGFNMFRGSGKFMSLVAIFLSMLAGLGLEQLVCFARKEGGAKNIFKKFAQILFVCSIVTASMAFAVKNPVTGKVSERWGNYMETLSPGDRIPIIAENNLLHNQKFIRDMALNSWRQILILSLKLALLSLLFLTAYRRPRYISLVGVFVVAEMLLFAWPYRVNDTVPRMGFPKDITNFLEKNLGDGRVLWTGKNRNRAMVSRQKILWGEALMPSQRYKEFMFLTAPEKPSDAGGELDPSIYSGIYGFLRCRYIVIDSGRSLKGLRQVFRGQEHDIYASPWYLPHVFFAPKWVVRPGLKNMFDVIKKPDFDPKTTGIVEKEPFRGERTLGEDDESGQDIVKVERQGVNYTEIYASIKRPGVLIISDPYYPAHKATDLTGRDKIYRVMPADHTLISIPLEEGEHRIAIRYSASSLLIGAVISFSCIAGLLIGGYFVGRKKRKATGGQG